MADDKTLRSLHDASRIALGEEHEVEYWTGTLGASAQELEEAVEAVGDSPDAVRAYLNN